MGERIFGKRRDAVVAPVSGGRGNGCAANSGALVPDELRLPMAASKASAGLAWTLVEPRLARWGLGEDARYDAHLILAELVANAVAVTPVGGGITVYCRRDAGGAVLGVADPCAGLPRHPSPVVEMEPEELDAGEEGFDDNGGWGLTLVAALSADCGVTPLDSGGKVVWARLQRRELFRKGRVMGGGIVGSWFRETLDIPGDVRWMSGRSLRMLRGAIVAHATWI
ncbi:ATP-binding protein [Actinocorallia libanotica]|uniref:Histidine kinase/HSP90-like ATPase domain-containing protein n=1 Tax=Actinocorallia libanotica TaxID=46162 RepID=A0ABN1RHI6_9ACTN